MIKMLRQAGIFLFLAVVLTGCGGGSSSDTGAGTTTGTETASAGCTGAQLAGTYSTTITSNGQTITETITFVESDFGTDSIQSFSGTIDGITLNITFDSSCNSFSGTFSDAATGLTGQISATRV